VNDWSQLKKLGEIMKPKDKEYLERNWMKLKKIKREIVIMTLAPLKGEDHYEILKDALFPIDRALTIMEKLIKED
jgi:hypothetical protein|tara:strand:+ start:325 stop:549 length:225 start_codon:yes stop_codon:yes gene_type:complete